MKLLSEVRPSMDAPRAAPEKETEPIGRRNRVRTSERGECHQLPSKLCSKRAGRADSQLLSMPTPRVWSEEKEWSCEWCSLFGSPCMLLPLPDIFCDNQFPLLSLVQSPVMRRPCPDQRCGCSLGIHSCSVSFGESFVAWSQEIILESFLGWLR